MGQFAMKCASLLRAERVIAIDRIPARLRLAATVSGAETINFDEENVLERLKQPTGGRGPDACVDAVGLEAHGWGTVGAMYDRAKTAMFLATDRLEALRQAIAACRKGEVGLKPA
jgi:threonine dehydrogenase-like Zn-dependent dehydrogenase